MAGHHVSMQWAQGPCALLMRRRCALRPGSIGAPECGLCAAPRALGCMCMHEAVGASCAVQAYPSAKLRHACALCGYVMYGFDCYLRQERQLWASTGCRTSCDA